jgi:hypothetical protein
MQFSGLRFDFKSQIRKFEIRSSKIGGGAEN